MKTGFRLIIDKITTNSNKLFLIDSLGALISAFFLGVILVRFEETFGMPITVLYILSLVACVFTIYSICCCLLLVSNWRPYLKGITIANMIYCCFTIGLVFYFYQKLTFFGLIYFLVELVVLICVIIIEIIALSKFIDRKI